MVYGGIYSKIHISFLSRIFGSSLSHLVPLFMHNMSDYYLYIGQAAAAATAASIDPKERRFKDSGLIFKCFLLAHLGPAHRKRGCFQTAWKFLSKRVVSYFIQSNFIFSHEHIYIQSGDSRTTFKHYTSTLSLELEKSERTSSACNSFSNSFLPRHIRVHSVEAMEQLNRVSRFRWFWSQVLPLSSIYTHCSWLTALRFEDASIWGVFDLLYLS